MKPTAYQDVNELLAKLPSQVQKILGDNLVGLYLYGSLATEGFNPRVSDIDLLAILKSEISDKEFEQLKFMHEDFAKDYPKWDNRIEVVYVSVDGLKNFKTEVSKVAVISPGESFHTKKVSKHWLMNWYMVREKGITLFGPDPKIFIPEISKQEFIESVKDHVREWNKWVETMQSKKSQAYAILTMCRALYAVENGEHVSKERGAKWTKEKFPQWSELIDNALKWRVEKENEIYNEAFPETKKFVNFIRDLILDSKVAEKEIIQIFNNSLVKQGYNKITRNYLADRDQFQNTKYLDKLVKLLRPQSTILDIGCGAGIPIDKFFIEKGYKVIGINFSEKQIELAKQNVPQGIFEVRDMMKLQENDYKVDAVVSFYAISHIPRESHQDLFRKINSFLSKGGLMLITMGSSNWEGTEEDFYGTKMWWSHYNAKKNSELVKNAGFEILIDEIDKSGNEKHQVILAKKI